MMRKPLAFCAVAALTAAPAGAAPADRNAEIRKEIRETYTFRPHELNDQQIQDNAKRLDVFWDKAKANRAAYVPAIRDELASADAPIFFLYDGSALLLSLSDAPPDRALALRAISRCDILDVQPSAYFHQVHDLAVRGGDTTEAALHILSEPRFTVVVPQHALTLGQDYCLVYMLLPTDPGLWRPRVIERLATEADQTAQKSLLLLLWYDQTPDSDAAIARFASSNDKPQSSRDRARELLQRNEAAGPTAGVKAAFRSESSIRSARRARMASVSDEALMDLDSLTRQLIAKR